MINKTRVLLCWGRTSLEISLKKQIVFGYIGLLSAIFVLSQTTPKAFNSPSLSTGINHRVSGCVCRGESHRSWPQGGLSGHTWGVTCSCLPPKWLLNATLELVRHFGIAPMALQVTCRSVTSKIWIHTECLAIFSRLWSGNTTISVLHKWAPGSTSTGTNSAHYHPPCELSWCRWSSKHSRPDANRSSANRIDINATVSSINNQSLNANTWFSKTKTNYKFLEAFKFSPLAVCSLSRSKSGPARSV